MVAEILARDRKATPRRSSPAKQARLKRHEWRLPDLAEELSMPSVTLYTWLMRGWDRRAINATVRTRGYALAPRFPVGPPK